MTMCTIYYKMLVVNDAMVLIHLAKITLLEISCNFFKEVMIPPLVYEETVKEGKKTGHADAILIEEIINRGKIKVRKVKKKQLIKKANNFNIQRGEAEAIALYWQEQAGRIASDDDNVRNKKELLEINLIGTPTILLALFQNKKIDMDKLKDSINELRKIGWFSNAVLDKVLMEAEK